MTDPAPATTFAHLDATTVLSRGIAELGIYPGKHKFLRTFEHDRPAHLALFHPLPPPLSPLSTAVDPLDSKSRMLDPRIVGQEHYDVASRVQRTLQEYKSLQDIIAILGMDELSEEDK